MSKTNQHIQNNNLQPQLDNHDESSELLEPVFTKEQQDLMMYEQELIKQILL